MDKPDLKDRVRSHWNKHPCGTGYAQTTHNDTIDLKKMEEVRYRLEPYILGLADFDSGRGKKVLEIGVGGGVDFQSWVRAGAHATGIDLTPAGVELARKRLTASGFAQESYALRVGDAENLEFEDNSFDIVYSFGVLHHSPDTVRAIQEVYRVLARGGVFRGMVYHVPSIVGWMLWVRYGLLTGRIFKTPRQAIYEHLESPGTKAYGVKEMYGMLERAGFVDVRVWPLLGAGDLLLTRRSDKYQSVIYALLWKLYPRWLIRLLGDRFGLGLMIVAQKSQAD